MANGTDTTGAAGAQPAAGTENKDTVARKQGTRPSIKKVGLVILALLLALGLMIGGYQLLSGEKPAAKTVAPAVTQEAPLPPNPVFSNMDNEDGEEDLDEDLNPAQKKEEDEDEAEGEEEPEAESDSKDN